MYISTNSTNVKHCWFSGRILACHAGDRGSIPRQCRIFKLLQNVQIRGFYTTSEKCQRCIDKYIDDGILIAISLKNISKKTQFQPGSNRRPFACKANVITTTLWNLCTREKKERSIAATTYSFQNLQLRKQPQFCPGSNRGPFACEANVITTTLQNCAFPKNLLDGTLHAQHWPQFYDISADQAVI